MSKLGRVNLSVENCQPRNEVTKPFEVTAQRQPVPFGRAAGKAVADSRKVELVEQARIDQLDFMRVEMCRRPPERREVERLRELIERGDRLDRLRRPNPREDVEQGDRLEPLLAQMLGAVGAEPFDNLPSAAMSRASCAKCGGLLPSASNIWIWAALLET